MEENYKKNIKLEAHRQKHVISAFQAWNFSIIMLRTRYSLYVFLSYTRYKKSDYNLRILTKQNISFITIFYCIFWRQQITMTKYDDYKP